MHVQPPATDFLKQCSIPLNTKIILWDTHLVKLLCGMNRVFLVGRRRYTMQPARLYKAHCFVKRPSDSRRAYGSRSSEANADSHTAEKVVLSKTDSHNLSLRKFASHVQKGFRKPVGQKRLSSMYMYDDEGSEWFSKLSEVDEYYLTRTEAAILEANAPSVSALVGAKPPLDVAGAAAMAGKGPSQLDVIELGAGDGRKTKIILSQLVQDGHPFTFFPVDVSEAALDSLALRMKEERLLSGLDIVPIVGTNEKGLDFVCSKNPGTRKLVLFLGSSLGNYSVTRALEFLNGLSSTLTSGDLLLIGLDLLKDPAVLLPAYNDSSGVTREFNLNLLRRMNRELCANFDISNWVHYPTYDPKTMAIQSWVMSTKQQTVAFDSPLFLPQQREFTFEPFEAVKLDMSHKYTSSAIARLAENSNFKVVSRFYDEDRKFCDSIWMVK